MHSIRILTAAALAGFGLVTVGLATEAANAASSKDLSVSYSHVMSHEVFEAYGRVSSHTARTVKLQYRYADHGSWTTKSTGASDANGYFSFDTSTTRARYYRFYAPTSGSSAKIIGNPRKVVVVSQSVKLFVVTPAYQCFNTAHQNITMLAQFYPARNGRSVEFTTHLGVKAAQEDSSGFAAVNFAPGSSAVSYSSVATALAYQGADQKVTSHRQYDEVFCL